jgi:5-methylthioadenosine/S-adenosylhomocysteine deaminase
MDFPAPGVPDPGENITTAEKFIDKWKNKNPRIHPSIFCHSPYTCSAKTLKRAKEMANHLEVLFQIHVAETRNEMELIVSSQGEIGCSVVQYLDELDILDRNTLMVHGVWLDKKDIEIIKIRKSPVVHCPESNMKLASGIAPVLPLMAAGIEVGLGTDSSASNNNLDLFSEMDMAAKLQKVAWDDPCVLKAKSVVEMATLGGARVLGLEQRIGSLTVGKQADLIAIELRQPHLVPLYDPYSTLVYNARGSDVIHVMVDGVFRVKNRIILSREEYNRPRSAHAKMKS